MCHMNRIAWGFFSVRHNAGPNQMPNSQIDGSRNA